MRDATAFSIRLYRKLAHAFPEEFQQLYGNDLIQSTEDLISDAARRRGLTGLVMLMARILADLAVRIPTEHASELWRDTRYAARTLAASKGFTLTSVLTLALSMGLCTAVFSQLKSFIMSPVAGVSEPETLTSVLRKVSYPVYESFRDDSGQFSEAAAYISAVPFAWTDQRPAVRVWGQIATPNYFDVVGAAIQLGRGFGVDETKPGIQPVAVISDRWWRSHLGGDSSIIGRVLHFNGKPVTIIGVAGRDFLGATPGLGAADLWVTTTVDPSLAPELAGNIFGDPKNKSFSVVGRLSPGINRTEAQATLETVGLQFEETTEAQRAKNMESRQALVTSARQVPITDDQLPVIVAVPSVLVGLILWISCSNIGTMLVARAAARRKEIAIRLSLGASRGRLVRQLLTESFVLALLGGAAGFLCAVWYNSDAEETLESFGPVYSTAKLYMDWSALAFTFFLSLMCAAAFGLWPAFRATRTDLAQDLKAGAYAHVGRFRWLTMRNVLVLQQVVGSLTLLLLTGFVALGMQRSAIVDPGFDTRNLYMMSFDAVRAGYSAEEAEAFFAGLRDRVKGIHGVQEASLSYNIPIGRLSGGGTTFTVRNDADAMSDALSAVRTEHVGPGFFETTGIPISRGRSFTQRDTAESRTVIVNEELAQRNWANQDPIGKFVELEGARHEVVGVAKNIGAGFMASAYPIIFQPMPAEDYRRPSVQGLSLIVRGNPGVDVMRLVGTEIERTNPDLAAFNASSVDEVVEEMRSGARETVLVYGGIGFFGLLLAAVGLAGVTAYSVAQRTKEIGIRVALGATRFDVLRLVTKEGAALIVVGTLVGNALAFAIMQAMNAWFYAIATVTKTSTSDPILLVGAPVLLAALAMIACLLPARRSMQISPVIALREE